MENNDLMKAFYGLLAIPSVKGEATKTAPFGEEVKNALIYTLDLAASLGFKVKNYDNYIGEAIYGEGKPFGILCHLDVVPAGNEAAWKTPPFTPTEIDGNLYCRGVLDDKCGAICSLFAIKRIIDEGLVPKREIRIIFGCDEESGWGCIDHYRKKATLPEEGISPDADFPVIYAEKGIIHAEYVIKKLKPFTLTGGTKANVVCDHARLTAEKDNDYALAEELGLKKTGENTFESFGVAAHGSTPQMGKNAFNGVIAYLSRLGYIESDVYDKLFNDSTGLNNISDETGNLTFSPDVATTDEDNLYLITDIRYPSTYDYGYIADRLKTVAPFNVKSFQPPLFVDKNSDLIKTLLSVYNEVTGENAEPVAIGGGTYARALKCGVAFGPSFGEEGYSIHQPNEYMPIKNIYKFTEIMYKAIKKLCF